MRYQILGWMLTAAWVIVPPMAAHADDLGDELLDDARRDERRNDLLQIEKHPEQRQPANEQQ